MPTQYKNIYSVLEVSELKGMNLKQYFWRVVKALNVNTLEWKKSKGSFIGTIIKNAAVHKKFILLEGPQSSVKYH